MTFEKESARLYSIGRGMWSGAATLLHVNVFSFVQRRIDFFAEHIPGGCDLAAEAYLLEIELDRMSIVGGHLPVDDFARFLGRKCLYGWKDIFTENWKRCLG